MGRKLKRTEAEVAHAAKCAYAQAWAEHEAKYGKSTFRYRLLEVTPDELTPRYWRAVFEITEASGSPVDGPVMVLVNDETLQVQIIEGP